MKDTAIRQEIIKRFLLGDLNEKERAALEDRFLDDGEIFERIEDAENDLVDDYVAGRLDRSEQKLFESFYMSVPANRAKIDAARFMLRELRNEKAEASDAQIDSSVPVSTGVWQPIRDLFASRILAPASVFAVLLSIAGGLWLAYRPQPNDQIVYSPTPAPTMTAVQPTTALSPETSFNAAPNIIQQTPVPSPTAERSRNAPAKTPPRLIEPNENAAPAPREPPAERSTITLALVTGLVRGNASANKLIVPNDARQVHLTFELPADGKYKEIEARLETVSGERIWSGKIRQTSGRAQVNLPADLFRDEDYLLITSGVDAAGKRIDFSQIYFNSERK